MAVISCTDSKNNKNHLTEIDKLQVSIDSLEKELIQNKGFEVKPQQITPYVETFTIQFSALHTNSFHLQLAWENTLVNIPIEVEVDQKIAQQMAEFMKTPDSIPHRTYFEAAQYYLNNDKSLEEALSFINAALEKSAENSRYGLLKAKIQDQVGDRKAALITINEANNWAKKAKNNRVVARGGFGGKKYSTWP